ncbi:beta-L-arabinofuranosidase domain-containing protein [Haladaptatus sp. AB643]|uniref:glycoside hydrolase family 127 protein n=1 Tax=unclassified Haladaptatus TaxID=2622732 RepID=UPI00209BEA3D|nr:glycoside hydrolase family 127 protein [Haladaptatus sp. AB643]MCO8254979.1 glycoside hydrolase family 127 protein [Haladaptatus sp. AB618]
MPLKPPEHRLTPVSLTNVSIHDEFWNHRLETNREVTLEHQYEQLETSGCLGNFRRASGREKGGFEGIWFIDSDAYKWLEAASYALATDPDPTLKSRVDEVVDLLADAQEADGYLNTYFILKEPDAKWTNLHMMHELYCAGHLIEAAVAHHRATDESGLLTVARNLADHIDDVFGTEAGALDGVPGHEEIELALVDLYRVTDESRYLDLAEYFIDRRGREDSRLEWEFDHLDEIAGDESEAHRNLFLDDGEYDGSYAQAHLPFREQTTVEGHAVRAMYFFSGVADVVAETGDEELYGTLETLWENMTKKRMYLTGGIGPEARHEGFTEDYDLRNRTAYAETCAAIGSIFWNHRMFQLTGEARFYDVLERALYNGFLAGVSLSGTEFFYENPLESRGDHHRKGWFTCACCPPNAARLFTDLGEYIYAQGPEDEVYVNLYVGSEASVSVDGAPLTLSQRTEYPWDDSVTLSVSADEAVETTLHLRVPEWCTNAGVTVNGEATKVGTDDGYVAVERTWSDGDEVTLTFDQPIVRMESHPNVSDDAGRLAFQRGPIVYCVEDVDIDRSVFHLRIPEDGSVVATYEADLLDGVVALDGDARVVTTDGWEDTLYREHTGDDLADVEFRAVPYYSWDNRDPGAMLVWLPTT